MQDVLKLGIAGLGTVGASVVRLIAKRDNRLAESAGRPIRVTAVDATGAGDCYDGAFLAEFLRTGDAFAAGAYANVAAALSTEGYSAVAPLPYRADVEARMTSEATR